MRKLPLYPTEWKDWILEIGSAKTHLKIPNKNTLEIENKKTLK